MTDKDRTVHKNTSMYGLTFTYIDDDTDLVTLGARAWKSRRGQLKTLARHPGRAVENALPA
jgi:hypothetical protein